MREREREREQESNRADFSAIDNSYFCGVCSSSWYIENASLFYFGTPLAFYIVLLNGAYFKAKGMPQLNDAAKWH